jgi:lysophospholipase L1-like esterase
VFNASIPGDRVADLLADAPGYAARLPARRVVIAVGVNDAWPRHRSIDAWIEDYRRLVALYAGHDLVLVEIYPPDPRVKGLAGRLDLGFIARANAAIRRIARAAGAHLVSAPEHLSTADGLHPSASGSQTWRGLLARAACP